MATPQPYPCPFYHQPNRTNTARRLLLLKAGRCLESGQRQYSDHDLLTYDFLQVTAAEGAVISSSRILIADLLGLLLVADPPRTKTGGIGTLIIFGAKVALGIGKSRSKTIDALIAK